MLFFERLSTTVGGGDPLAGKSEVVDPNGGADSREPRSGARFSSNVLRSSIFFRFSVAAGSGTLPVQGLVSPSKSLCQRHLL
ncbi:unnamed protein product [Linum trigynum]|uniref:Uncharacterized protein n=1 Tax=Linum trigynum TaxID=586398 RepID=A0AAV2G661_9ROSI